MPVLARSLVFVLMFAAFLAGCAAKGPRSEGEDGVELSEFALADTDPGVAYFEWRETSRDRAPISLTTDDGTPLQLSLLRAHAVIEDPLAFTELTLNVYNPELQPRAVELELELPPGAVMSRVALLSDGEWLEAEVVQRQVGNAFHEDALYGHHDPALREHEVGNRFRARIHPFPDDGSVWLRIAYSQPLDAADRHYRLALAGLPRLEQFDVTVELLRSAHDVLPAVLGGRNHELERLTLSERDLERTADLELHFEREVVERGLRQGELVIGRIAPVVDAEPEPIAGLTILFDTSASRALDFDAQVERIAALIAALAVDDDFPLEVLAFDESVAPIYAGSARAFGSEGRNRLLARRALGASDIVGALEQLAAREPLARVLIVSDGIDTIASGNREVPLRRAAASLRAHGVERIDALVDGGLRDSSMLRALTTGNLAHDGIIAEAQLDTATLVGKLERATRSGIAVDVKGAEWVWPTVLDAVQQGDEVLVHAKLPRRRPMIVTLYDRSGERRRIGVPTRAAQDAQLERAWTQAQLDEMTTRLYALPRGSASDELARAQLRDEIVELSRREHVLSEFTALVLPASTSESERLGIDGEALADVLVIGFDGVERLPRRRSPVAPPSPFGLHDDNFEVTGSYALASDDAAVWRELLGVQYQGHGLIGMDARPRDPYNGWIGIGNGTSGPRVGHVQIGKIEIAGKLDRDLTRRIVRAHAGELRACYSRALSRKPGTAGRISIQFAVTERGKVSTSEIVANGTEDLRLATCAAKAARRWSFPRPSDRRLAIVKASFSFESPPGQRRSVQHTGPWSQRHAEIMQLLASRDYVFALSEAWRWRDAEPSSELALLALGEVAQAMGMTELADRAHGSLVDLYPSRTDFRRLVDERRARAP